MKSKLEIYKDYFFKQDHHITFYFEIDQEPINLQILSGNVTLLGLPNKDNFNLQEIIEHIETINALSEIEGKESFIEDTINAICKMEEEHHFYLPFKLNNQVVWCSIGLERANNNIFGRVNRINYSIPKAIEYYQKAFQDPLTRLFTRETLRMHLSYIKEFDGKYGLYIDIDDFKTVNDSHGHAVGDGLLKAIAQAFIDDWEHNVIYYRLGGDEFFVYVMEHSKAQVCQRANNIIKQIESIEYLGKTYPISASIGIVPIEEETVDYLTLLDLGDQLMYQSKAKGKGQFTMYEIND